MKNKNDVRKNVSINFKMVLVIVLVVSILSGCGSTIEEKQPDYISMVQTGYFGEFTDASVAEVLNANFGLSGMKQDWRCKEMNGIPVVSYYFYLDGQEQEAGTTILFKICSDQTFKIAGYAECGNEDFEITQIADTINSYYMNWYILNKIGADASEDESFAGMQKLVQEKFDNISGSAALYGAAKEYSGNRGELCREIDGSDPLNLTVTELMNLYSENMLAVYSSDDMSGDDSENSALQENSYPAVDNSVWTFYSEEGDDAIIKLSEDENNIMHIWYGNTSGQAYYTNDYVSFSDDGQVMCCYTNDGMVDEFDFYEGGYVEVLLGGYGSSHYQAYLTEEAYTYEEESSNEIYSLQLADGDVLKSFARDNGNIGTVITFDAKVGGNYAQLGIYLLYCYCVDGSFVEIQATAIDGMNLFDGDVITYTGTFDGFTGGGNQLQCTTISVEIQ